MTPVLLLVDLQQDFLARPGLVPAAERIVAACAGLLGACRARSIPVLHARTRITADGADAMPHWRRLGIRACVAGSPGAEPPPELAAAAGEPVFHKTFYSPFQDPRLLPTLERLGAGPLLLAGLYEHACLRQTVLEAYARGFEIWLAADATGSDDPLHALLSRRHLAARAAWVAPAAALVARLDGMPAASPAADRPAARINGQDRRGAGDEAVVECRDPGDWRRLLARVPLAAAERVGDAALAAALAQPAWAERPAAERAARLRAWAARLREQAAARAADLAREIGKPLRDGAEELERAAGLIEAAAADVEGAGSDGARATGHRIRRLPLGVVGLITPWNNPIGIPAGKIAAALAWGNAVVWKPAVEAPDSALALLDGLESAGIPTGLVNLVFGQAAAGEALIAEPAVAAVSLTGSEATGRRAAALCALHGKPLQAELGGNNAALIMPGTDPAALAPALLRAAFSFAGQRCTALRRFIVHRQAAPALQQALLQGLARLRLGRAADPDTEVGPVISPAHCRRLEGILERALAAGARLLGRAPAAGLPPSGCWFPPALLAVEDSESALVREESFGPIAVLQPVDSFEDGLAALNAVPQGLGASLFSPDPGHRARFLAAAQAGILRLNDPRQAIHPQAPFGGWKASGLGPPEHGPGNRAFYTRLQTVYGDGPENPS